MNAPLTYPFIELYKTTKCRKKKIKRKNMELKKTLNVIYGKRKNVGVNYISKLEQTVFLAFR